MTDQSKTSPPTSETLPAKTPNTPTRTAAPTTFVGAGFNPAREHKPGGRT